MYTSLGAKGLNVTGTDIQFNYLCRPLVAINMLLDCQYRFGRFTCWRTRLSKYVCLQYGRSSALCCCLQLYEPWIEGMIYCHWHSVINTQTEPTKRAVCILNLLKPTGHVMHQQFNIQQLYVLPTHCVYVFCIYLRTNSDLCHLQHKLIGFYNRDEKFLLRGTNWVFK